MHFRHLITVIFLILTSQGEIFGQDSGFSSRFQEASRLEEEGESDRAFQIWAGLASDHPDNGNVNYRAGKAYLNSGRQKNASLPFLEQAIEIGISKNYDPLSPAEKKSPIEVYYYLAKAYHLNYKLDEAEIAYAKFIGEASGKHYLQGGAILGRTQVGNARLLQKNPVEFNITNLGPVVNTAYPEFSPVISIDENALFFTSKRLRADSSNFGVKDRISGEFFEDIYASYKNRNGEWQTPELLEINSDDHSATINVSVDGQTLFLYKDDNGIGNIYESKLVGETWTEPIKMDGINSNSWETHLALSADGQMAYFVSNRSGGLGGRDIYRVKKLPNGNWSAPMNLGSNINTPYEEDAVFISPDELTLYFSSEGHNSMGGFDVFTSTLDESGEWKRPENIGYPINTTDDDVFFVTSADGKRAYYSSVKASGYGEKDIYIIDLPRPQEVKLALLRGLIITAGNQKVPGDMVINVINKGTRESTVFTPRQRDGSFVAVLPPCFDYDVEYEIGGQIVATDTFSIDCESSYQEIYKELMLNPIKIAEDGTVSILREEADDVVAVSSTGGDLIPASYKRFFGYNEIALAEEEQVFKRFMRNLQKLTDAKDQVEITIVGSASKVPTKTFGNNEKLAELRANDARKRILEFADEMKVDKTKLKFIKVEGSVQGPDYQDDFNTRQQDYRQFQYIDIVAK